MTPIPAEPSFAEGGPICIEGILFFIDAEYPQTVFAGSPSSDTSEKGLNLIVSEAIRTLPRLFADHPETVQTITGRELIVVIVEDYFEGRNVFLREQLMTWDVVSDFLAGDKTQ